MNEPQLSNCKLCNEPIYWAKHKNGSSMPVDPKVSEGGNIVLTWNGKEVSYRVLKLGEPLGKGEKGRFSHFRSCRVHLARKAKGKK